MSKIAKALNKSVTSPSGKGGRGTRGKATTAHSSQVIELNKRVLARNRISLGLDDQEIYDYYNLLRTQVLQRTRDLGQNTIMVTGTTTGVGATTTSINLAISIAKELGQHCLLVDAHLRRAHVDDILGWQATTGLSDYILKDVPIYKLQVRTSLDKFSVLPAGEPIIGSTEILGSPKMQLLVQEMKERYPDRYVIFNCPAVLTSPDALVFSDYVDGILLVVDAKTNRAQVAKAMTLLEGRNVLGTVLNKATELID